MLSTDKLAVFVIQKQGSVARPKLLDARQSVKSSNAAFNHMLLAVCWCYLVGKDKTRHIGRKKSKYVGFIPIWQTFSDKLQTQNAVFMN